MFWTCRFDFSSANRRDKNMEFFELAERQLESQRLLERPSVYATEAEHKELVRKLGGEIVQNADDATVIIASATQPEDTSEIWVRAAQRKDNQVFSLVFAVSLLTKSFSEPTGEEIVITHEFASRYWSTFVKHQTRTITGSTQRPNPPKHHRGRPTTPATK